MRSFGICKSEKNNYQKSLLQFKEFGAWQLEFTKLTWNKAKLYVYNTGLSQAQGLGCETWQRTSPDLAQRCWESSKTNPQSTGMREFLLKEEKKSTKIQPVGSGASATSSIWFKPANQQTPWFWMCQLQNSLKPHIFMCPELLDWSFRILGQQFWV